MTTRNSEEQALNYEKLIERRQTRKLHIGNLGICESSDFLTGRQ